MSTDLTGRTDLALRTTAPRRVSVPVRGGDLAAGIWGPDDPAAPVILAVHGITASHRCWPLVAVALPHCRIIAPDLRGRGRSADLPAPYGLARHAEDLEQLLDHLAVEEVTVVGHSMGGFVAVSLADRVRERVSALVLVDGGLPLAPPPGGAPRPDATAEEVLGPAAQRLTMSFESREAYRDFWRVHPAFAGHWNPTVEGYVDYDLQGEPPHLRPSARVEAVATDAAQLTGGEVLDGRSYEGALSDLAVPTIFLRAPRGLMDEPEALYPPDVAETARDWVPHLVDVEVEDVNHYTIVMAEPGARAVARAATRAMVAVG